VFILFFSKKEHDDHEFVDHNVKELNYNPKYEELWTPKCGPDNPNLSDHHKAVKNTLSGFVEPATINDFQFDVQRKTFVSYGYAIDPTENATSGKLIGDVAIADQNNGKINYKQ
jgi:pre-mRNA-processing factor 17